MTRPFHAILSFALLGSLLTAQQPEPAPAGEGRDKPAPVSEEQPKPAPSEGEKPVGEEKPGEEKPAAEEGQAPKPESEAGTEVDLPEDQPLPPGANAEDLRAMQSARDMVAAERRLRAAIKAGKIKDVDKLLSFEEISSWPYEDGLDGMPKAVRELDGGEVIMTGFMLPIDEVEQIREFLLVQSLWACCYGTPPDINGVVRVVMKGEARTDYLFDPIQIRGTFEVEATEEDGYVIDIYQLHADSVGGIN